MNLLYLALFVACLFAACIPRGFRPPPSDEEAFTSKNHPTVNQVRKALNDCGDSQPMQRKEDESLDNGRARVVECMFSKGYYFKSGSGSYCSNPDYRVKLPACANVPIRSRNNYYGQ